VIAPEYIVAIFVSGAIGFIGWLVKRQIDRHEGDDVDRETRAREYAKAQADRVEASVNEYVKRVDAHMLRQGIDINALGHKVNQHHDEMLRDYVHEDRLKERMESALMPISATLSRIERVIESDHREIFTQLGKKLDR
jgi:hypothetical protein